MCKSKILMAICCTYLGRPSTDMFVSYSNKQLDKYVSWHSEPFSIVKMHSVRVGTKGTSTSFLLSKVKKVLAKIMGHGRPM